MGRGRGALAAVTPSRMIRIWGERTYEGKVFELSARATRLYSLLLYLPFVRTDRK
jgi:hypothetical protein